MAKLDRPNKNRTTTTKVSKYNNKKINLKKLRKLAIFNFILVTISLVLNYEKIVLLYKNLQDFIGY